MVDVKSSFGIFCDMLSFNDITIEQDIFRAVKYKEKKSIRKMEHFLYELYHRY